VTKKLLLAGQEIKSFKKIKLEFIYGRIMADGSETGARIFKGMLSFFKFF